MMPFLISFLSITVLSCLARFQGQFPVDSNGNSLYIGLFAVAVNVMIKTRGPRIFLAYFLWVALFFILVGHDVESYFSDSIPSIAYLFPGTLYLDLVMPWVYQISAVMVLLILGTNERMQLTLVTLASSVILVIAQNIFLSQKIFSIQASNNAVAIKVSLILIASASGILLFVCKSQSLKFKWLHAFAYASIILLIIFQVRYFSITGIWLNLAIMKAAIFGTLMSDGNISIRAVESTFLTDILPGWAACMFFLRSPLELSRRKAVMSAFALLLIAIMIILTGSPKQNSWIEARVIPWPRTVANYIMPSKIIANDSVLAWQGLGQKMRKIYTHRNVMFIVVEGLRSDALDSMRMPFLDSIAKNNIVFQNHFSSGNGTPLGMFSLLTGESPCNYMLHWKNKTKSAFESMLPKHRLFSGNSGGWGFCRMDSVLFKGYTDISRSHRDLKTIDAMDSAITSSDQPFFAVIMLDGTHYPYNPNVGNLRIPDDTIAYFKSDKFSWDNDRISREKSGYWLCVKNADNNIRLIFNKLKNHQILDSMIIFITGDHGEEFFELGHFAHSTDANALQSKVPGILFSGQKIHSNVQAYTSHTDVWKFIKSDLLGNLMDTINAIPLNRKVLTWSFPMRSFDYPLEYATFFSPNGTLRVLRTPKGLIEDPWNNEEQAYPQ